MTKLKQRGEQSATWCQFGDPSGQSGELRGPGKRAEGGSGVRGRESLSFSCILLVLARYVEPAQELSGPSHDGGGLTAATMRAELTLFGLRKPRKEHRREVTKTGSAGSSLEP